MKLLGSTNTISAFLNIVVCLIFAILLLSLSEAKVERPRGVAVSRSSLYQPSENFVCFDGLSTIAFERINDDYCDCLDGSDEPGTSACPNGSFHCSNHGYKSRYIPSSRVNDGICDCCDGSDEYNSWRHCYNNCHELGRRIREAAESRQKQLLAGHELYKEYCTKGLDIKKHKLQLLEKLQKDISELEVLRTQLATLKNEAEAAETEAKTRRTELWRQVEEAKKNSVTTDVMTDQEIFDETGLRRVYPSADEANSNQDEIQDGGEMPAYDDDGREKIEKADRARREFQEVDVKFTNLREEISDLDALLQVEMGVDAEYYYLHGQCFELTDQEYTYTLCPFDKVTQRNRNGGVSTDLGKWGSWDGPDGNKYSKMKYEHGLACWSDSERSVQVHVHCGPTNQVVSVAEPVICQYELNFTTPAACSQSPATLDKDPLHDEL